MEAGRLAVTYPGRDNGGLELGWGVTKGEGDRILYPLWSRIDRIPQWHSRGVWEWGVKDDELFGLSSWKDGVAISWEERTVGREDLGRRASSQFQTCWVLGVVPDSEGLYPDFPSHHKGTKRAVHCSVCRPHSLPMSSCPLHDATWFTPWMLIWPGWQLEFATN